jgi:UDP-N-acetylmuramate dehydrogenase
MVSHSIEALQNQFGKRLLVDEPLARYTTARVGGPADALLVAENADELAEFSVAVWEQELPLIVLGAGSNVLISESGIRGVVILNRARRVKFDERSDPPTVWAESGANFSSVARQAAERGLSGLEWASGIPGTVGGAVVGNAGAHGSDMAHNLLMAEILHRKKLTGMDRYINLLKEKWAAEQLGYEYRSSIIKRQTIQAIVLVALLKLVRSTAGVVQERMEALNEYRRKTQPPGANLGSMFKNPAGDYAGRLIDAAGLKGAEIGDAVISPQHANFFVNRGCATASDVYRLITLARKTVLEKFGENLQLEIELLGDWSEVED